MTTNFRSSAPILSWVNAVFGTLIQPVPDGQPEYVPLDSHRTEVGSVPAVTVLGAQAHADLPRAAADPLRDREAAVVAAVIRQILTDGWQVYDERTSTWRHARHDDIAILVPTRSSLPHLEDALDGSGIPDRAEASSLVYSFTDVRSPLACARAIADTSDALSLVTALRSTLFGCGDDDLWRWVNSRSNWPTVAHAYTPPNIAGVPPERTRSRSSMQSAPAAIPAMIEVILPAGFAPADLTREVLNDTRLADQLRQARPARPSPAPAPAPPTTPAPRHRRSAWPATSHQVASLSVPFRIG